MRSTWTLVRLPPAMISAASVSASRMTRTPGRWPASHSISTPRGGTSAAVTDGRQGRPLQVHLQATSGEPGGGDAVGVPRDPGVGRTAQPIPVAVALSVAARLGAQRQRPRPARPDHDCLDRLLAAGQDLAQVVVAVVEAPSQRPAQPITRGSVDRARRSDGEDGRWITMAMGGGPCGFGGRVPSLPPPMPSA